MQKKKSNTIKISQAGEQFIWSVALKVQTNIVLILAL
jgi:hypothetical protein